MLFLLVLKLTTIAILAGVAIVSFSLGLLYKKALVAKHRKRILRLEDEMLSNHSTILELEKKLAEIQKEKETSTDYNLSQRKPTDLGGLKAS